MRINGTRLRARWLLLAVASGLLAVLPFPLPSAAQEAKPWSEKETQLATQYLSLLVKQPEPGRVLDLLWELYDKRGQTDFLLQSIANQVKQRENSATLLIHGHLLRKAGKPDDAKSNYQRALDLQPDLAQQAIALRSLAELARDAGQRNEALQWFERLLKVMPADDPQRPRSLIELGRFALDAGKVEEAAAAWEEAARLKPKDTESSVPE
jgi:tetratricopeptide (TPR) repeat protein